MSISKERIGDKEAFRFESKRKKEGDFAFDDYGFSLNKAVYQSRIVPISYSSDIKVDCSEGNIFTLTLEGNADISLLNARPGVYTIIVKQDGTGSRTLTFPDAYRVESAEGAPSYGSQSANTINMVSVLYDGTDYFVSSSEEYVEIGSL